MMSFKEFPSKFQVWHLRRTNQIVAAAWSRESKCAYEHPSTGKKSWNGHVLTKPEILENAAWLLVWGLPSTLFRFENAIQIGGINAELTF